MSTTNIVPIALALLMTTPAISKADESSPSIFIERQTNCVNEAALRESLEQALGVYRGSRHMMVAVVIAPAVDGNAVALRVVMTSTGEIVLDRQLKLSEADCENAHQFIRLVLEQFLTEFPIDDWIREKVPEERGAARPGNEEVPTVAIVEKMSTVNPHFLKWRLVFSLDGRLPTPSGDVDLSTGIDVGSNRHGFVSAVGARLGYPHSLDEGRYLETVFLFNTGWRFSPTSNLDLNTEIHVGPLLVSSFGYAMEYRHVVLWLEGQLSLAWRLGPVQLGPLVAVSPLQHSVSTIAGTRREIPWIRIGLMLGIPLWEKKVKANRCSGN